MALSIDKLTVSTNAAVNTTIGTLTLTDSGGTVRQTNYALNEIAAAFFGISGSKLVTLRTPIPAGYYSINLYYNAEYVPLSGEAAYVITVTGT